ncbi:hypothetical protein L1D14_10700 [Vibrio tubiashii]|uniref:hypothetical protein n=1 Tax=Vibrio tubiashii TaxID=29498 RepID=UPI001EFD8C9A|nr:hypothetical protein [Vibrio tubiashii]MCG9576707.1 hypothetical protein [Vibrio tubiashii]
MYSNRPLDEIAYSPKIFRGVTLMEAFGIIFATFFETAWLCGWLIVSVDSVIFIAFFLLGLIYLVFQCFIRASKWGRLKSELPGSLAYMYIEKKRARYLCIPVLFTLGILFFIFLVFVPLLLVVVGWGGVGLAFGFHLMYFSFNKLTQRFPSLVPSFVDDGKRELIGGADVMFGTDREPRLK